MDSESQHGVDPGCLFESWEAFQLGYAGFQTRELEEKSLALAGRQDDFCIICFRKLKPERLYPQISAREIHYCPRRFCEDCCDIDKHWHRQSSRFKTPIYQTLAPFVGQTCLLCWKRCWDEVPPILGASNPAWQHVPSACHDTVQKIRHQDWRDIVLDPCHWRKALIRCHDDMSIESDRRLLLDIYNNFPANNAKYLTKRGVQMLRSQHDLRQYVEASCTHNVFDREKCFQINLAATHAVVSMQDSTDDRYADIARSHLDCIGPFSRAEIAMTEHLRDPHSNTDHGHGDSEEHLASPAYQATDGSVCNQLSNTHAGPGGALRASVENAGPQIELHSEQGLVADNFDDSLASEAERSSSYDSTMQDAGSDVTWEDDDVDANEHDPTYPTIDSPVSEGEVIETVQRFHRLSGLRSSRKHLQALDAVDDTEDICPDAGLPRCTEPEDDHLGEAGSLKAVCQTPALQLQPISALNSRISPRENRQVWAGVSPAQPSFSPVSEQPLREESGSATTPSPLSAWEEAHSRLEKMDRLRADIMLNLGLARSEFIQITDEREKAHAEIDRLRESVQKQGQIEKELEDWKKSFAAVQQEKQQLASQVAQLEKALQKQGQIEKELNDLKHTFAAAQQENRLLVSQKTRLEIVLSEQEDRYRDQQNKYEEKINNQAEALDIQQASYQALKDEKEMLQEDWMRSQETLSKHVKEVGLLRSQLEEAKQKQLETTDANESLQKERSKLYVNINELETRNAKLESKCKTSEDEIKTINKQVISLRNTCKKNMESYTSKLAQAALENHQMQEDIGSLLIEHLTARDMRWLTFKSRIHMAADILSKAVLSRIRSYPVVRERLAQYENRSSASKDTAGVGIIDLTGEPGFSTTAAAAAAVDTMTNATMGSTYAARPTNTLHVNHETPNKRVKYS